MEVFVINGHDYSRYIASKGYGWSREDLDSEKTKRTKDGVLRRDKITTKRKLSFKMMNMSQEVTAQLDNDLSQDIFTLTYLDLHGVMTKKFYCSSFRADLDGILSGEVQDWRGATFNVIEV